jgi:hypothetical protein
MKVYFTSELPVKALDEEDPRDPFYLFTTLIQTNQINVMPTQTKSPIVVIPGYNSVKFKMSIPSEILIVRQREITQQNLTPSPSPI